MQRATPLAGLKVIDFSAVYAGPICTRMLSDCGADVVKIETPHGGDMIRGPKGRSRVFAHFNAGKRSLALDLSRPEGRQIALDLVRDADVVVENFRPGVMKKLGLDQQTLRELNPRLVYCSISGFGQDGPESQRAAYASIAHASSGFDVANQRAQPDEDRRPDNSAVMIADMLTGSYAYGAIQTALLGRERTGRGDYVDVTMLESMMLLIPGQMQMAQNPRPTPIGGFSPIRTSDGFVMLCIVSPKNLRELFEAIERPDLNEDERFTFGNRAKNMAAFTAEVEAWSTALTSEACEQRLNDANVPCSRYLAPEDQFEREQIKVLDSFTTLTDEHGDYLVQNVPFRMASGSVNTFSKEPLLGEHTEEVLREKLGMDAERIEALRSAGLFGR